jgi:hypothetical protein
MQLLTVDRNRWDRGHGDRGRLLGAEGYCIQGWLCHDAGVRDIDLLNQTAVTWMQDLPYMPALLMEDMRGYRRSSTLAFALAKINDNPHMSDATREHQLAALLAQHNILVQFVGGPDDDQIGTVAEDHASLPGAALAGAVGQLGSPEGGVACH